MAADQRVLGEDKLGGDDQNDVKKLCRLTGVHERART
jgi:hypothetical protein